MSSFSHPLGLYAYKDTPPSDDANDFPEEQVEVRDSCYIWGSVGDDNGNFEWKRFTQDLANKTDMFKFWKTEKKQRAYFKYDLAKVKQFILNVNSEIGKDSTIDVEYLDRMGSSSGMDLHCLEMSWDAVDFTDTRSIIFTDDIHVHDALGDGILRYQHMIRDNDVSVVKAAFKKFGAEDFSYRANEVIAIQLPASFKLTSLD